MPIKAKDLISKAKPGPVLNRAAMDELKLVLAHNDQTCGYHDPRWVSRSATIDMLSSWGYPCGKDGLQKLCRQLGRKGYLNA
jgi:hypothetical protein